jgi:hypothetical protein
MEITIYVRLAIIGLVQTVYTYLSICHPTHANIVGIYPHNLTIYTRRKLMSKPILGNVTFEDLHRMTPDQVRELTQKVRDAKTDTTQQPKTQQSPKNSNSG